MSADAATAVAIPKTVIEPHVIVLEDDAGAPLVRHARPARGGLRGHDRRDRGELLACGRTRSRDALVVDIGLPDADGRDVVQALRAQGIGDARDLPHGTRRAARPARRLRGGRRRLPDEAVRLRRARRPAARADQAGRGATSPSRSGSCASTRRPTPRRAAAQRPSSRRPSSASSHAWRPAPGDAVRRRELVEAAWPHGAIVHDNTLDVYIARLRRKLADAARRAGDRDRPRRRLLAAMRRPRLRVGVRTRLLSRSSAPSRSRSLIGVAAFNLLLGQRLSASATSRSREAQAAAESRSLEVGGGPLVPPRHPTKA